MSHELGMISDAELREKLILMGFPKVPITETTRGILINKIKRSFKQKTNSGRKQILKDRIHKSQLNSCSLYAAQFQNKIRSSNEDEEMPRKCSKRIVQYVHDDESQYCKMSSMCSTLTGNLQKDTSYLNTLDYANHATSDIHIPPTTRTDQQSHLGVVNRLLSFRDKTFQNPKTSESKLHSLLSIPKETNKYMYKSRRKIYNLVSYMNEQSRLNQSFTPYLLVGTFILFFTCLTLIYVFRSPNILDINNNSEIIICKGSNDQGTCVPATQVSNSLSLIREIMKLLQIRTKKHYCRNKVIGVSEAELIKHMEENGYGHKVNTLREHILSAKLLIQHNPQWKILIISSKATQVKSNEITEDTLFALSKPTISFFCTIYTKIQSFFLIIGIGAIIVALSISSLTIYRYIRAWRVNRSNIVEQFTTDIVNDLIYRASLSEAPEEREVIVTHLRDKLIPLTKRGTYLKFWKEALQVLETNDSRIQFGIKFCDGEECRTMKWIGNANTNVRTNGLLKKWQSPAFDYANKIVNPPTSCLKIRHMFDSSEINIPNLKPIIEAALLEKVGSRCNIQDIQIDKQSCCVYVRCGSEFDAGIIHNEINGWWFDKRLISIKFLRLHRYLARFPGGNSSAELK